MMMSLNRWTGRVGLAGSSREHEPAALVGAGLMSSVGSLPWHMMPLIVAALVADGRVSVTGAGWVSASFLFGQLTAALSLPSLRVHALSRPSALATVAGLLAGLVASTYPTGLFPGWFVAGLCCGALQYLGLTTAADSSNRTLSFTLRLGVVMIIAGLTAASLCVTGDFASYAAAMAVLTVVAGGLAAGGLILYQPPTTPVPAQDSAAARTSLRDGLMGLGAILILFIGQTGFLAYVIQAAALRGLPMEDTALALAAMKLCVGVWLVYAARRSRARPRTKRMLSTGLLLALGIAVAAVSEHMLLFFLSLLLFEFAFNTISASLQARVVQASPAVGRNWLTAAILIGAALGPPLHGAVLGWSSRDYFIVFAMASALVPALWAWRHPGPKPSRT